MATLYITEYFQMAAPNAGALMPQEPPLAEQVISLGNVATLSAPFNPRTTFIRLISDTACAVEIGFPPFLGTTSWRMAVDTEVMRGVSQGEGMQIAAVVLVGAATQPIPTADASNYDTQTVVETLGQILQELKVLTYMMYMASAQNDARPLDDPALLRTDFSVFNQ